MLDDSDIFFGSYLRSTEIKLVLLDEMPASGAITYNKNLLRNDISRLFLKTRYLLSKGEYPLISSGNHTHVEIKDETVEMAEVTDAFAMLVQCSLTAGLKLSGLRR